MEYLPAHGNPFKHIHGILQLVYTGIMMKTDRIKALYDDLQSRHGRPRDQWRLWCKRPKTMRDREQIAIEAILTQHTNWRNVETAVASLRRARALSFDGLARFARRPETLWSLIRPAGFYRGKTRSLLSLARFVRTAGGMRNLLQQDSMQLRSALLRLPGIGFETADSILLYACDKPSFVIDEYTRRLVRSQRIASDFSYEYLRHLFEKSLRKDYRVYQDFHARIVIDGKQR